eukprot:391846_1
MPLNKTNHSVNYCSLNQYTMNMLASGMWTNNGKQWIPYCIEWNNNDYCKPYCCQMKFDTNIIPKNKYVQFRIGDSTLLYRTHEIGNPFVESRYSNEFNKLINIDFKKDIDNKTIILATNPNLHQVSKFENLYENEIDVVIVGGTGVHEQLWPVQDLITQYRVRWHDECIKNKIELINKIRRDKTQYNDNVSVCVNRSLDDIFFRLKKDIWFIDISDIRMARWDVNRIHDKIHGWLDAPAELYQYAMLDRGYSNDII